MSVVVTKQSKVEVPTIRSALQRFTLPMAYNMLSSKEIYSFLGKYSVKLRFQFTYLGL